MLDAPAQRNGSLLLKGKLMPTPTPTATVAKMVQGDGRFALSAVLAGSSLVCYNDTIFRDDFDGDGF